MNITIENVSMKFKENKALDNVMLLLPISNFTYEMVENAG